MYEDNQNKDFDFKDIFNQQPQTENSENKNETLNDNSSSNSENNSESNISNNDSKNIIIKESKYEPCKGCPSSLNSFLSKLKNSNNCLFESKRQNSENNVAPVFAPSCYNSQNFIETQNLICQYFNPLPFDIKDETESNIDDDKKTSQIIFYTIEKEKTLNKKNEINEDNLNKNGTGEEKTSNDLNKNEMDGNNSNKNRTEKETLMSQDKDFSFEELFGIQNPKQLYNNSNPEGSFGSPCNQNLNLNNNSENNIYNNFNNTIKPQSEIWGLSESIPNNPDACHRKLIIETINNDVKTNSNTATIQ